MPGPAFPHARLRFALVSVVLSAVAVLAASCVEAVGAGGYTDAVADACALADRCYGPAYATCDEKIGRVVTADPTTWLELVDDSGCLGSCNVLLRCLDFAPICGGLREADRECAINEDCCGFSAGTAACASGLCCRPIGTACDDDLDCCPSSGLCEPETGTCGGVVCAVPGEVCVNDFQCCTGRCGDGGACEDIPCPPAGFACESDADCCNLLCDPDTLRCTDPATCSLLGESCLIDDDCCNASHVCNTQDGVGGVCSTGPCNPDNSDCIASADCCSGLCILEYNLCGNCVEKGAACSPAAPCCGTLTCNGTCK